MRNRQSIRAGEVHIGEVRIGEVPIGESRQRNRVGKVNGAALDVAKSKPAPDHGKGGLNIRPCQSQRVRAGRLGWRGCSRVHADERAEHFHHGGVISLGVASDALQCVDAADTDVRLVRAELLDGLGVAVGTSA